MQILNGNKKQMNLGGEGIFTAISVGFFFVLIGILLITTPNLFSNFLDFVKSFRLIDVPGTSIVFPGPVSPENHIALYQAAELFSFVLVVFQIIMLILRFFAQSSWGSGRRRNRDNRKTWFQSAYLPAWTVESRFQSCRAGFACPHNPRPCTCRAP